MGKVSLNFTDPFGASPHSLNVDELITLKELSRLLAEELGYAQTEIRHVGAIFNNTPALPVIYDPRIGVLSGGLSLNSFNIIKNNTTFSYYIFPPSSLTANDILLESGTQLSEVSLLVTVEWAGNYYPILLPKQIKEEDISLIKIVFAQLKIILGIQAMPQNWQRLARWQLSNVRTGEHIDGALKDNVIEKIHNGDLLHLLAKTHTEQDEILILDEKNEQASGELDIKIADDFLDSIKIEQAEPVKISNCTIELLQGDITVQEVDAIVNAAKPTLDGGGGVDGAIHQAAGPALVRASQTLAPCAPGKAVITPGFSLQAKWVIHTVGPIYQDGKQGEEKVLENAYRASLAIAFFSGFRSVAFPAISTGAYGYPPDQAAKITWRAIKDSLLENKDSALTLLRVIVPDDYLYEIYANALHQL